MKWNFPINNVKSVPDKKKLLFIPITPLKNCLFFVLLQIAFVATSDLSLSRQL